MNHELYVARQAIGLDMSAFHPDCENALMNHRKRRKLHKSHGDQTVADSIVKNHLKDMFTITVLQSFKDLLFYRITAARASLRSTHPFRRGPKLR